jgi:hypothetical protein
MKRWLLLVLALLLAGVAGATTPVYFEFPVRMPSQYGGWHLIDNVGTAPNTGYKGHVRFYHAEGTDTTGHSASYIGNGYFRLIVPATGIYTGYEKDNGSGPGAAGDSLISGLNHIALIGPEGAGSGTITEVQGGTLVTVTNGGGPIATVDGNTTGLDARYVKNGQPGAITTGMIPDGEILEADLNVYNAPSSGNYFRWNSTQGKPEWTTGGTGLLKGGASGTDVDFLGTAGRITLVAGSNMAIVGDNTAKTLTFTSTAAGGGDVTGMHTGANGSAGTIDGPNYLKFKINPITGTTDSLSGEPRLAVDATALDTKFVTHNDATGIDLAGTATARAYDLIGDRYVYAGADGTAGAVKITNVGGNAYTITTQTGQTGAKTLTLPMYGSSDYVGFTYNYLLGTNSSGYTEWNASPNLVSLVLGKGGDINYGIDFTTGTAGTPRHTYLKPSTGVTADWTMRLPSKAATATGSNYQWLVGNNSGTETSTYWTQLTTSGAVLSPAGDTGQKKSNPEYEDQPPAYGEGEDPIPGYPAFPETFIYSLCDSIPPGADSTWIPRMAMAADTSLLTTEDETDSQRFRKDVTVDGNLTVNGTLATTWNVELTNDLTVMDDLFVSGMAVLGDSVYAGDNLTLGGNLKLFEGHINLNDGSVMIDGDSRTGYFRNGVRLDGLSTFYGVFRDTLPSFFERAVDVDTLRAAGSVGYAGELLRNGGAGAVSWAPPDSTMFPNGSLSVFDFCVTGTPGVGKFLGFSGTIGATWSTVSLSAGAVSDSTYLSSGVVTSAKIVDGQVKLADLQNGAVDSTKVTDGKGSIKDFKIQGTQETGVGLVATGTGGVMWGTGFGYAVLDDNGRIGVYVHGMTTSSAAVVSPHGTTTAGEPTGDFARVMCACKAESLIIKGWDPNADGPAAGATVDYSYSIKRR